MGSGSWCIFHSCMCIILSVARSTSCLYDISISVGSILTHDSFLDFSFRFMIRNSQIAWITVQKPKAIPNQNFWLLTEHWIPQLPKNTIVDLCASVLVCWYVCVRSFHVTQHLALQTLCALLPKIDERCKSENLWIYWHLFLALFCAHSYSLACAIGAHTIYKFP